MVGEGGEEKDDEKEAEIPDVKEKMLVKNLVGKLGKRRKGWKRRAARKKKKKMETAKKMQNMTILQEMPIDFPNSQVWEQK